jgi:rSAM/selenodomain-associated transferase 1
MSDIPLLIFAKAPEPGKVKTRLLPNCKPQQAATIAEILLKASLQVAKSAWPGKVVLSTWPDTSDKTIQTLARQFQVELVLQGAGDLGRKMVHALDTHGYPAAILGSDASLVAPASLHSAHQLLQEGKNVIGPCFDGGYYLIGLSQPQPQLFVDMPWGTDQVLDLTLARQRGQKDLKLLQETYDIDTWTDVQRARAQLPELDAFLLQEF